MRTVLIVFLCTASVCLAQESYHNDEFGFTIDIPSQWHALYEEQWPDKLKAGLKRAYSDEPLLLLSPSGTKTPGTSLILIQADELKTTSEAKARLKKDGGKDMIKRAKYTALAKLGKKIKQYREIDSFYDYDSSRHHAGAEILYEHKNDENIKFIATTDAFIGLQRIVRFRGHWERGDPEEFRKVFNEVIDSFEFDQDAKPKGILGAIKETGDMSKEQKFNLIWKWGGIILTISIIIGIAKYVLGR